jgi:hypothetical protein
MANYKLYPRAFDEAILLGIMRGPVREYAERIKATAEAIAPAGKDYRESFHVVDASYVGPASRGGARAESIVFNSDPAALYIEYGTSDTPEHATLRKAAFSV